ncbi:hypothetical protein ACJQWK_09425 [Exserohilum turcicum]
MNVEACRVRNQSSWLKYTAFWAAIYQNIGGATIITIWWMLIHNMSSPKSYYQSGRTVPLPYARVILLGTILFYIIPTLAIWLPTSKSMDALQNILAFWQFTPLLVNIPLWLVYPTSSLTVTSKNKNSDIFHLRILYVFMFFFSIAVHWYTIYGISVSPHPDVTYARVFVPSTYTWKKDAAWGLLWIFQCDWVVMTVMCVIHSCVTVCDIQRVKKGEASLENIFESFLIIMTITIGGGPPAALSAVWYWREGHMAAIENASAAKKGQ